MSSHEVPQNQTMDQRASQALSLQLSTQSLVKVDPVRYRTLWARAKMLGRSATKKGSLVIENSFPSPVGIDESESCLYNDAKQTSEPDPEEDEEKFPPCDGGRRAWACLLGAATIEGLIWGMYPPWFCDLILTYHQVFQWHLESFNHTSKLVCPSKTIDLSPSLEYWQPYITLHPSLTPYWRDSQGISYLGNPLITPFTIRYQKYQRHMICIGWLICIVALLSSSFATKLWHLMVTQGILYAMGYVILYYPVLNMVNEWFVKKRGLAYGLM